MDFNVLIQQPESLRDEAWEANFLEGLVSTKVEVVKDEPQAGPDGWPYLLVKTRTDQGDSLIQVIEWLFPRGVGMAVNTHKNLPDYVFTYGMIWNYAETGKFVTPREEQKTAGEVVFDKQSLMGEPSPKYLPTYVRRVLRDFLTAQGFKQPRVVAITSSDYKVTDLVFASESVAPLGPGEQAKLAEAIGWFLPLHYSVVFANTANLRGWVDL